MADCLSSKLRGVLKSDRNLSSLKSGTKRKRRRKNAKKFQDSICTRILKGTNELRTYQHKSNEMNEWNWN